MITGCMLLVAGASKVTQLSAVPIVTWFVFPKELVFGTGVLEFVLGWGCLTMVPHRLLRQALTGLFSVFLVVLAVQWWGGEVRCQCLGSLSLPIAEMAGIDLFLLLSLIFFHRDWERRLDIKGFFGEQAANLQVVVPGILLASIAMFGSVDATRAYLSGQTILVDAVTRFAGEVKQNEFVDVSFKLRNPTSSPVRVLGAKASCTCIAILDLPVTIEAGDERIVRLRVYGRTADTLQRESAELRFDDSALRLALNATTIVRPNH